MPVTVAGLNVHPVKSTAIRPVERATVERAGFAGDRRWMVVDAEGGLVSARELHDLFSVVADVPQTDPDVREGLRLRAAGHPELTVPDSAPEDVLDEVGVRLHRHDLTGAAVSHAADAWLRTVTGRADLRLIRCIDPTRRALNPDFGAEGDHTAYADGYPVTLASMASLARLNDWITEGALERGDAEPARLPIERFRANVVVDGDLEPFAEDGWRRIRIGEVGFRVAKPVDRCVMTTIDLSSLDTGKEPLRTLARHRRWDGKTWFAMQLIPDSTGTVRVGDEVQPQ